MGKKHQKKANSRQNAEMHNRRSFLATLGAGAVLATGGGLYGFWKRNNISIDEARKIPSLRQRYIDNLVGDTKIPYCDGVIYDHDGDRIISFFDNLFKKHGDRESSSMIGGTYDSFKGGDYDMKTPDALNTAGKGEYTSIFIGRKLFDDPSMSFLTSEDTRHIILAHEAEHCRQHGEGLQYIESHAILDGLENGTIRQDTLYHAFEYDAYCRDLPRAITGEFNVSPQYLRVCKRKFAQTDYGLYLASKSASSKEKEFIDKVREQSKQLRRIL